MFQCDMLHRYQSFAIAKINLKIRNSITRNITTVNVVIIGIREFSYVKIVYVCLKNNHRRSLSRFYPRNVSLDFSLLCFQTDFSNLQPPAMIYN